MYQLEKWQHSSWQKDTRFYSLELCQDLFGNWIIKRTWGSAVKQDFGRSNSTSAPTIKRVYFGTKNKLPVVKNGDMYQRIN